MSRIYLRRINGDFRVKYKYYIKIDGILQNQSMNFNDIIAIDLPSGGHVLEVYQKSNPASRFYFFIEENEEIYFYVGNNWKFMSRIMWMTFISTIPFLIGLVTHPAVLFLGVVMFFITILYLLIYGYVMRNIYAIEEKFRRKIQM